MIFQHFILTRSCYRQTDLKYVHYRFRLLRDFCARSLVDQTCHNFTWIVRCNPHSPLAGEYAELFRGLPFPVICLSSPPPDKDASDTIYTKDSTWKPAIQKTLETQTTHVLTTRIDDDDGFAPFFAEKLQKTVQPIAKPVVWNYPTGYVLRLMSRGSMAHRWRFIKNQFASLLSPVDPLVTVNDATHGHIHDLGPIHVVSEKPAFIWVRHPLTKSRGGRFKARVPVQNLASDFPFLNGVQ